MSTSRSQDRSSRRKPRISAAAAPTRSRQPKTAIDNEPVRLQKLLARNGYGSRRQIEAMIAAGRISINKARARPGDRAGQGDQIRLDGKLIQFKVSTQLPRVLIYHKPEGEIVSKRDPQGRPTVFDRLPRARSSRWIAIGRLDFNTSGLLIFTTDGNLADRLMHPRYQMEREYAVRIVGELTVEQSRQLTTGIELEDGPAKFDQLSDAGGTGTNRWYRVVLKEGRNREVRRMFEALGFTVSRLIRVRFGPINLLSRLKRGMWMQLPNDEVVRLLTLVDLPSPAVRTKRTPAAANRRR